MLNERNQKLNEGGRELVLSRWSEKLDYTAGREAYTKQEGHEVYSKQKGWGARTRQRGGKLALSAWVGKLVLNKEGKGLIKLMGWGPRIKRKGR